MFIIMIISMLALVAVEGPGEFSPVSNEEVRPIRVNEMGPNKR